MEQRRSHSLLSSPSIRRSPSAAARAAPVEARLHVASDGRASVWINTSTIDPLKLQRSSSQIATPARPAEVLRRVNSRTPDLSDPGFHIMRRKGQPDGLPQPGIETASRETQQSSSEGERSSQRTASRMETAFLSCARALSRRNVTSYNLNPGPTLLSTPGSSFCRSFRTTQTQRSWNISWSTCAGDDAEELFDGAIRTQVA